MDRFTPVSDAAEPSWFATVRRGDVVWFDGYDIPAHLGSELVGIARTGRIDDRGYSTFDVDVLVDPDAPTTRSKGARVDHTTLTGLTYSLVRREFRDATRPPAPEDPVLVMFGGTDVADLTRRTCEQVLSAGIDVRVVVPRGVAVPEGVERLTPPVRLAELMSRSSVLIGAAGHLTVEAACVGLPAVIVCVAENQRRLARTLVRSDVSTELTLDGWMDDVVSATARSRQQATHQRRSDRLRDLVDGHGARRVFDALEGIPR